MTESPPAPQRDGNDLLFLMGVVVVSVTPYVWRLGFYSDDWATLGLLLNAPDQSLGGLLATYYRLHYKNRMRPTQLVYEVVLYKMFGATPLGYHVVNAAIFASLALLLYLVMREFCVHRSVALAVSSVYVLLPNYSTDRFWYVAFFYPLTTALFLASTYAFLKATRSRHVWLWTIVALLALTAAALGTEVVLPLTLLLPIAIWFRLHRSEAGLRARLGATGTILLVCGPMIVVVAACLFKMNAAPVNNLPGLFYIVRLAIGSLAVNFGTFGVALPQTIAWALPQLPWSAVILALVLGVVVFLYLVKVSAPPELPSSFWIRLVIAGGGVFILGTAIFLITAQILFWSTGIANRVWIAAGIGMALLLVGGSGWLSAHAPSGLRRWVFAGLVTVLCLSGFVVNTVLSTFWIAAWPRQLAVLEDIQRALPELRPRTTLLLDAVCPYLGPAIVFESSWDLAGALQVAYRDPTLRADVTTSRLSITDDSVSTRIYDISNSYQYGPNLILFNPRQRTVVPLSDADVAHARLAAPTNCPQGIPGQGATALPLDAWFLKVEAKGFRPWR